MVTQPTVSWVTRTIPHDSTKKNAPRRWARSESATVVMPRAAATWSSTAITVLVPNSQASSTRGASVSSTSHSGMTMLSSTWCVVRTPPRIAVAR